MSHDSLFRPMKGVIGVVWVVVFIWCIWAEISEGVLKNVRSLVLIIGRAGGADAILGLTLLSDFG